MAYVTPTENMAVRPGQHVDPQGQVYHPYLAGWPTFWDVGFMVPRVRFVRDPDLTVKPRNQRYSIFLPSCGMSSRKNLPSYLDNNKLQHRARSSSSSKPRHHPQYPLFRQA